MPAAKLNVTIEQGADWQQALIWKDSTGAAISLVGYTAKAQVRRAPNASELYLTATTADSTIVLGGVLGTIAIHVPAATTAALTFTGGSWDLVLTSGTGVITRLVEGQVTLDRSVTV